MVCWERTICIQRKPRYFNSNIFSACEYNIFYLYTHGIDKNRFVVVVVAVVVVKRYK